MKIKQISHIGNDNIIDLTIRNRQVKDVELFLNPLAFNDFTDSLKILNMTSAVLKVLQYIKDGKRIGILVDEDADGYTSAASLYDYLNTNYEVELVYIVHDEKAHGLTPYAMNKAIEYKLDLIIIPDAGSNDLKEVNKLYKNGIEVVVLDHHNVDTPIEKGILVNNQLCDYTNKEFTGVGMVYKFMEAMDEISESAHVVDAKDYLDLLAVGQIGDSSDISTPEIRKLVYLGITNIRNKFVKAAMEEVVGFNTPTPKDLSFSVIPVINAVTRVGSVEDREIMFEALANVGTQREFIVKKKTKNKVTGKFDTNELVYNIYQYAYDNCKKIKNKQANIIKKILPDIVTSVNVELPISVGIVNTDEYKGLSGLIANKLVNKFDKPALLLNDKGNVFTGSGRGCEKIVEDFRSWCEESKLVEFASGHAGAFGIEIKKENYQLFIEYAKNSLGDAQEVVYEVDLISDRPSPTECELIYENRHLFGGSVTEPLIGFENITIPKRFISNRGSVLNLYSWGIGIVRFNTEEDLIEEIENYPHSDVKFNIVGTYGMNNWNGRLTPQFIVKDLEIVYSNETNEYNTDDDELIF